MAHPGQWSLLLLTGILWLASFVLRARTKEFDAQRGNHVWGSLTVSKLL